jgi:hypothetical protein
LRRNKLCRSGNSYSRIFFVKHGATVANLPTPKHWIATEVAARFVVNKGYKNFIFATHGTEKIVPF